MECKDDNSINILLGCAGKDYLETTIALVKLLKQVKFKKDVVQIKVVVTSFPSKELQSLKKLKELCPVYQDEDEWNEWKDECQILHINLRRWADIFVIAPLTAHYLAKIACGLCNDLLTCVIRAWDLQKPVMFCPTMSSSMWNNPLTANHITTLKSYGYQEIPCNISDDYYHMAEVTEIVNRIVELFQNA